MIGRGDPAANARAKRRRRKKEPPFDTAAKQALLEATDIETRAELTIQLMQFFGRHDGDERVTLQ